MSTAPANGQTWLREGDHHKGLSVNAMTRLVPLTGFAAWAATATAFFWLAF